MPAFNGPLNHSDSTAMLLEIAAHGVRGIGIFNNVTERNSLSSTVRSSPYLAYMCNDDKLYVYDGPRNSIVGLTDKQQSVSNSDWTNTSNWTEVGAEANDLTSSVTWTNVPSANITEASVTQHEAALSIAQSQVSNLPGDLSGLQGQISLNDSDIATNASGISSNAQSISTLNTTVANLDTDDITEASNLYYTTGRFNSAFNGKSTDDLSQGSTNLYNVQADWDSTAGLSKILNKPAQFDPTAHSHVISDITNLQSSLDAKVDDSQVQTDVPANAVFTDTTYSVQDGELSQNNFTDALKANLDNQSGTNTGDQDLTLYQLQPSEGAFEDGDKTRLDGIEEFPDDLQSFNEVTGATLGAASDGDYYFLVDNQTTTPQEYNKLDSNGLLQIFTQQVADYLIDNGFLSSDEISFEGLLADLNGDGTVGTVDLLILLGQYGSSTSELRSDFTYSSAPSVALQTPTYTQNDWVTIPLAGTATRVIPAGAPDSAAWNIDKDLPGDYIELEDYTVVDAQSTTTVFTSLYGGWRQVSGPKSFEFKDCEISMVFSALDVVNLRIKIEFYEGTTLQSTEHFLIPDFHAQQVGSGNVTKSLNQDISTFVTNKWPSQNSDIDIIRVKLQVQSEQGNLSSIEVDDGGKFIISVGQE